MENNNKDSIISWTGAINMALGIWLFLSAWMVPAEMAAARADDLIFGDAILVLSVLRISIRGRAGLASWLSALAGLWLVVAPFALRYELAGQRLNSIGVGLVVAGLAIASGSAGLSRQPAATA